MLRLLALFFVLLALAPAGAQNLLANGDFDNGAAGWSFWFQPGQAEGAAEALERDGRSVLAVTVVRRGGGSSIQIYQGPFALAAGQRYRVAFDARADEPFELPLRLMGHNPPYRGLGLETRVPLTEQWRTYTLTATAPVDHDDARLDFFPERSFRLDNVVVAPLEAAAAGDAVAPRAAILGPGWGGDPAALLSAEGRVTSGWEPHEPLFVMLDLGEPRAVSQVLITTAVDNRWRSLGRLEVEVGAGDAAEPPTDWRRWATASRGPEADGLVEWSASSLLVRARWLRLRVAQVQQNALLHRVQAVAMPDADGVEPAVLPAVHPAEDLSFVGWDYERYGYDHQPLEPIVLRWRNMGNRAVDVPVTTALTPRDEPAGAGQPARLTVAPGEVGEVTVADPGTELTDGAWQAVVSFPDSPRAPEPFYLDHRRPAARVTPLRVVALFDNNDREGWATMLAGPLGDTIEAYSDFTPPHDAIDAALVAIEDWPADDPRIAALGDYLAGGGRAIVWGKPAPALDALLPVAVDRDAPFLPDPLRLVPGAEGPWEGWDADAGPRHYGMKVSAKPGAAVLATWSDGTPAVVEGAVGDGRVVYVGTGSGQVWQNNSALRDADELALRLLYRLTGREAEWPRALARAAGLARERMTRRDIHLTPLRGFRGAVAPALDNVGRFGWNDDDGGLVDNIYPDGRVLSPANSGCVWQPLTAPGGEPLTADGVETESNWLSKQWRWPAGWSAELTLAHPLTRWQPERWPAALRAGDATHVAYQTADGVRVVPRGAAVDGADLARPWLIFFRADAEHRDTPRLLILQQRPTRVSWSDSGELSLEGGRAGLWLGALWGLRRLAPGATAAWVNELPADAAAAADRLCRSVLAWPAQCVEAADVDGDTATIGDGYILRPYANAWGDEPLRLAPLPPVLSLARRMGVPVEVEGEVIDLGIATKYGPLEAVAGDRLTYRLPLPPRDHYGPVPVAGRQELQPIIDYYGQQGFNSVTSASGGLVTHTDYLEDLRRYMSSGSYKDPYAAPCIDLYKWWYCFPAVSGRPAYSPEARAAADAHYVEQYRRVLNYYGRKGFVQYRREPRSGLDYTVSFIWPVTWRDGTRFFVDQNESAAVIAECLETYARYYGDWTTVAANWNLMRRIHDYLPRVHDWACMASSNQEYYSTVGIDMLNSEYPGNWSMAVMAERVGDDDRARLARVLAAKALVPTVARFGMPDYIASISAEGDPWRNDRYYYTFQEGSVGGQPTVEMRGGPESIMHLAIGMLDTSKGTGPLLPLAYKEWAGEAMDRYQRELAAEEAQRGNAVGWAHQMQRGILGWPREEVIATATRFRELVPNYGWQSAKAPHNLAVVETRPGELFLADWAPAGYVTGEMDPAAGRATLQMTLTEAPSYELRAYSRRAVTGMSVDGAPLAADAWRYDPATGWLTATIAATGEHSVALTLGEATAPLHAYLR